MLYTISDIAAVMVFRSRDYDIVKFNIVYSIKITIADALRSNLKNKIFISNDPSLVGITTLFCSLAFL